MKTPGLFGHPRFVEGHPDRLKLRHEARMRRWYAKLDYEGYKKPVAFYAAGSKGQWQAPGIAEEPVYRDLREVEHIGLRYARGFCEHGYKPEGCVWCDAALAAKRMRE